MLKQVRHTQIKDIVEDRGQVTVAELNAILNVSEATVRRDLDEMARAGIVRRTHGGALRAQPAEKEPPILVREGEQAAEKARIGRLAASLVRDNQTVFLGSGTTVQAMVPYLAACCDLTIITNSLPVVNALSGRTNIDLIVVGGMFRQSEQSMVGHIAEQALRELRADIAFMGMRAIDPGQGFTSDFLPEALTDRAILQMAPRRVVVADHTKFGRVSSVFLAPVTVAHDIVSDSGLDPAMAEELRELGLQVHLA